MKNFIAQVIVVVMNLILTIATAILALETNITALYALALIVWPGIMVILFLHLDNIKEDSQ